MKNTDITKLIHDPGEWNDAWENAGLGERSEMLFATIREELPEEFDEGVDLNDCVLVWLADIYAKEKEFETAHSFLAEYSERHPALYRESAHYFESYFTDYYLFTGDFEKVKLQREVYLANPVRTVRKMLFFFNKLWYWELGDWALELARQSYKPVADSEDILDIAEEALSLSIFYISLHEAWERYEATGRIDFSEVKNAAAEYKLEIREDAWDTFERAFAAMDDQSQPSKEDNNMVAALFMLYMRRRGMNFITARQIIEDMYDYWRGPASGGPGRFFPMKKDTFERHIARHRVLLSLDLTAAFRSLWGAVYVYDFLFSYRLIPQEQYEEALQRISALKADALSALKTRLWEAVFVCKAWPKPDSLPDEAFEQERVAFEESFRRKWEPIEENTGSLKKKPAYEKKPKPPTNPAKAEARKRKKKKKKR